MEWNKSELIKDSDVVYVCNSCHCDDCNPCKLILDKEDPEPKFCIYGDSEPEWTLTNSNKGR